MARQLVGLWEVHLRVPEVGPVAMACKRGGTRMFPEVVRIANPADTLRVLEHLLADFAPGDRLFMTARANDSKLSMWSTGSKAAGLYWAATALSKLWVRAQRSPRPASATSAAAQVATAEPQPSRTVA